MPRLHLIIHGRVQGVFFRASAQGIANELGVRGWVRNRFDGAVEMVAEGPAAALHKLRAWASDGPPGARVHRLEELNEAETGEFERFSVRG